jgi:hypothetical protein
MGKQSTLRQAALAAAAILLSAGGRTAGSTVTVAQNPPAAGMCYEVYIPVCGMRSGVRKTYSNECFAKADQATEITPGACEPAK